MRSPSCYQLLLFYFKPKWTVSKGMIQLNNIFKALIVSQVTYAVSSWGGFLSMDLVQWIDSFLCLLSGNLETV